MPALEDTYRSQRALHIVFAISSVAMLVSILWMMADDHYREWKKLQREYLDLEAARAERETNPDQLAKQIAELEDDLAAAEQQVAEEGKAAAAQQEIDRLTGQFEKAKQKLSFREADRVSKASYLDIAIEKVALGTGTESEFKKIEAELEELDEEIKTLRGDAETLKDQVDGFRKERDEAQKPVTDLQKKLSEKEQELKRVKQKKWSWKTAVRSWPIMDAFAAPVKIEQVVLNDLTINYSFRNVPRFDRCTTCHKAIDAVTRDGRPQYDDEVIRQISDSEGWHSPHAAAFRTHSRPELFAGANSPHPRERFGCTVCHLGQGSATDFLYASHAPDSLDQEKDWKENKQKNYHWHEIHDWPWPMNKARFVQSGCVKCHPHIVDLENGKFGNTAPKLVQGYHLVRQFGCFGCHEINGFKNGRLIGPDLRVEPQTKEEQDKAAKDPNNPPGRMRKVGPSLRHIAEKVPAEWTFRWIKLPRGFRPDTRMPQFYGLPNNDGKTPGSDPQDVVRSNVELHAITHYLYTASSKYVADVRDAKELDAAAFDELVQRRDELDARVQQAAKSAKLTDEQKKQLEADKRELDSLKYRTSLRDLPELQEPPVTIEVAADAQTARGKQRFIERGCLACHSHSSVDPKEYPGATADFGPELSNVAAKLRDAEGKPNTKWLFNWLKDPTVHHATSFMPNLQLSDDEAADIAAWLLSVEGKWATDPGMPKLEGEVLEELDRLIVLFLQKSKTLREANEVPTKGIKPGKEKETSDEKLLEAPITTEKKLAYIGKKTISRMGCFGCHDIPGFETAKPIGTELNNWGFKARLDPDKLDFAHIVEYLEHEVPDDRKDADFEMFLEGMKHHPFGKGESFLWGKLREPRSYDYNKEKPWDDRLRMPRFTFDPDPKKNTEAIEAVMTFVLGLVADDSIPAHYRTVPQSGAKFALIEGARALDKFNCRGCHMMKMPEYAFDVQKAQLEELDRSNEFESTKRDQAAMMRRSARVKDGTASVQAMLVGSNVALEPGARFPAKTAIAETLAAGDTPELNLELWEPAELQGRQYLVGDKLNIPLSAIDVIRSQPALGGQFAELLVAHLSPRMRQQGKPERDAWNFVPPPLVREGMKAQPAWLHQFLLNPHEIRPAVPLRMPRFNMSSDEAGQLAAYFAAADGVAFPYEPVPQRETSYLAAHERQHAGYLRGGWKLLSARADPQAAGQLQLCASCHQAGNVAPTGKPEERGPNLRFAPDRLRPDWLRQWIAAPRRLLPYTAMPANFAVGPPQYQEQFSAPTEVQILGVRDALMNYHKVQQDELAAGQLAQPASGGQ